MKGSVFIQQIKSLPRIPDREDAVERAVRDGHAVRWPFHDIHVDAGDSTITVRVAADYFAIGEEDDFVRIPLSPLSAQRICDMFDAVLPTSRLVDLIWNGADVRLAPIPWGPPYDASMLTVDRFAAHDKRVETARAGRTGLVAGHKKDVILTQRLAAKPKQVAIYGWHRTNGVPIQPITLWHENTYSDYSHGIRLVARTAYLDGAPVSVESLLSSPELAHYLSAEGPLTVLRQPGVARIGLPPVDDGKPLGHRALAVAQAELARPGWESPVGSHAGPRIKEYFAGCQRNGKPLGLVSGNWCAAFVSFCEARATHDGDEVPHGYRAAVAELWADALQRGAARKNDGKYKPALGDLAIFGRDGQDPRVGGKGHVGRVSKEPDAAGNYETIDGNHFNAVGRVARRLADALGFVAYPRADVAPVAPTEEELNTGSELLGGTPSDEPEVPPAGPQRLPADKTVVTEIQLFQALEKGWTALWGDRPHRTSLLVLLAHWALETGRGKSMHAYNLGNIKSREGDGHDYTYFACNELLHGKWVWFYPDDAGCRFRAYKTLDLGVQDYLSLLKRRFTQAWPAVIAGSPADFCHLLKVQGYYTANEQSYTNAVVSIFNEYSRTIPTDGAHIDVGTTLGVQQALLELGYDPGPATGLPSPKLTAAVRAFQSQHALAVDGIVGPNTRAGLIAALQAKAEANRPKALQLPTFEPTPPGVRTRDHGHGPPERLTLIAEVQPARGRSPDRSHPKKGADRGAGAKSGGAKSATSKSKSSKSAASKSTPAKSPPSSPRPRRSKKPVDAAS